MTAFSPKPCTSPELTISTFPRRPANRTPQTQLEVTIDSSCARGAPITLRSPSSETVPEFCCLRTLNSECRMLAMMTRTAMLRLKQTAPNTPKRCAAPGLR